MNQAVRAARRGLLPQKISAYPHGYLLFAMRQGPPDARPSPACCTLVCT